MEESGGPRVHFVSLTFIAGFGIGIFLGVALALAAFAVTREEQRQSTVSTGLDESTTPPPGGTADASRLRTASSLDVYLGPGDAYAIIGTLGRGVALQPIGRDLTGEWVAISFPPGSTGRGWVQVAGLEDTDTVSSLAVVEPTPLARSTARSTPSSGAASGSDNGSGDDETAATPGATGTPRPTATRVTGPDLAITGVRVISDGRVSITIGNRGNADLGSLSVKATIQDRVGIRETVANPSPGLAPGSAITVLTNTFIVTSEIEVRIVLDPSLPDTDTSNNATTVVLSPIGQPASTATPVPGATASP